MNLFRLSCVVLFAALLFSACEDHQHTLYNGDSANFRFAEKSYATSENTIAPVAIPILFSKSAQATGSVSVSISGGTQDVDYEILNPSLTFDFSADQYSDTLRIRPVDNAEENPPLLLTLTLSGTARIGWSGDTTSQDCILKINDNDGCPAYDPSFFVGNAVQGNNANGESGLNGLDPINGAFTSMISGAGGDALSVSNLGGISDSFANAGVDGSPNPCTMTLVGGGQTGTVQISGSTGFELQSGEAIDYGGTGTYDICSGTINVEWNLNYPSGLLFSGEATYTY